MNAIVTLNGSEAVTTTLAIAEGTDTQHKNVLELVRTYQADLEEFGGVAFETRPFETTGGMQRREIAILNEQQSTLILTYMRNSDIVRGFKKRLVKAFWELAKQPAAPLIPQTLPEALRLAADLADQKAKVEEQLAIVAPKAEALDRIATFGNGSYCIREAAKLLSVQEKRLRQRLQEIHWIYHPPIGGNWLGYAQAREKGYVEHKRIEGEKLDGSRWESVQVRITDKGLAKLATMIQAEAA